MLYQLLPSSFNDKGNIRKGFKNQTERGGNLPGRKSPQRNWDMPITDSSTWTVNLKKTSFDYKSPLAPVISPPSEFALLRRFEA